MPSVRRRPAVLHRAMRYSVFSGGKRIRPVLCLAAADAVGSPCRTALVPAAAVELLHTYTLIHDDLPCMDDDDFRRGKPTSHKVFGEANAVLAGDALQALAFELLGRITAPTPYPPNQLVLELARAAGSVGVVGGQVEDLAVAGTRQSPQTVRFIHMQKTARLFCAAVRMGAIAAGASAKQLRDLTTYGVNVGLAFQMTDDLLDAVSTGTKRGKHDEMTCLSIYSPEEVRKRVQVLIRKSMAAVRRLTGPVEPLISIARSIANRTS